jgi:hypothetical protein
MFGIALPSVIIIAGILILGMLIYALIADISKRRKERARLLNQVRWTSRSTREITHPWKEFKG